MSETLSSTSSFKDLWQISSDEEVSGRNRLCRPQKSASWVIRSMGIRTIHTYVLKVRPESVRVLGYMASCALSTNHVVGK